MKTVIRTAETHPLTGVCAMTNSRYGSTNTRAKTAMPGRVSPGGMAPDDIVNGGKSRV